MFIIQVRGGNWFLAADPITTYYQTQDRDLALRYPSEEAAVAAVSDYYRGDHYQTPNKYRWSIHSF